MIARGVRNELAAGLMRHADAGYDIALAVAREKALDLLGIFG